MIKDSLFKKIEDKTNVNKETIVSLAEKLQKNNIKDEKTILEIIDELSRLTGKEVSNEKKERIVNAILNEKVPNNIEKMI